MIGPIGSMRGCDRLTGLPDRYALMSELRFGPPGGLAILVCDLDCFARTNEEVGYGTGDGILIHVARTLEQIAAGDGAVFRSDGDEFTVVLRNSSETRALHVATRALSMLRRADQSAGVAVSLSIGLAAPEVPADPLEVLGWAGRATAAAKRLGGGRVEVFTEALRSAGQRRNAIASDLRRAIGADQLRLAYQPEFDLRTWRCIGAEALLRWDADGGRQADTSELIEIAEQSNLIVDLGDWALHRALADATATWPADRAAAMSVAVNVSPRQVLYPGFAARVAAVIARSSLRPEQVCLEITETALADDVDRVIAALRELRSVGVQLAIDDFGTGHASLSYLARFPVDIVKIDRLFVAGLGVDPAARVIVNSTVQMAHALGMRVVAEGIETQSQLDMVAAAGCDVGQGYLFARAVPPAELADAIGSTPHALVHRPSLDGAAATSTRDRAGRYRLLLDLAHDITGRTDIEEIFARTFAALRQLLDFTGGSIQLIDEDTLGIAAADPTPTVEALHARLPLGQGVGGRIAVTGEPRYIPDIVDDPEVPTARRKRNVSTGVRAYFGVPLIAYGEIIGVLQIDSSTPDAFDEEDRFVVLAFTPVVAAAIRAALERLRSDDAQRSLVLPAQRQPREIDVTTGPTSS